MRSAVRLHKEKDSNKRIQRLAAGGINSSNQFAVMGGHALNCNEVFQGEALMQAKKDMLDINKQRAFWHETCKYQEDAIQIISQEKPVSELRTQALDSLIKWKIQSGFTKVLQQHNTVAKKGEL